MFKNDTTFKSKLGGTFTILGKVVILGYFLFQVADVIQKKTTVTNSSYIRNTAIEDTEYNYDISNFDVAVNLRYALSSYEPNIPK